VTSAGSGGGGVSLIVEGDPFAPDKDLSPMRLPRPSYSLPLCAALAATALALTGCASATSADTPQPGGAPESDAQLGAVWVANEHDDSLTVLDARSGGTVATLTGIAAPHNVQASATRDVVWVTGTGGVVALDAVGLFPTEAAPAGSHPAHVVEAASGSVFVAAAGDGVVHRFSSTLEPDRTYSVGEGPHGMRVTSDGRLAAVANTDTGTVSLLRPETDRRARTVEVGGSPVQVAVTDDGSTVFVSVAATREVVRVDVASGTVTGRVEVPAAPAQIWVTSEGTVLSADQGGPEAPGSTVSIIDGRTMQVVDTIEVGSGPHGITVDPEETRAWVTNVYDDTVSVVDLATATVVDTLDVGTYPNGITYTPVEPDEPEHDPVRLILPHAYSHPEEGGHSHDDGQAAGETDEHGHDDGH
jgi:YVTN family beta-propeller protein